MSTQEIDVLPLIDGDSETTRTTNTCFSRRKLLRILALLGLLVLEIVVMLTMTSISTEEPRYVFMCCDSDEYMDESGICLMTNGTVKELKVPKLVNENGINGFYETSQFLLVPNWPPCSGDYTLRLLDPIENHADQWRVSEKGYLQNENKEIIALPIQFCIEYLNSRMVSMVCAMDSEIYSDGELESYQEESIVNWMDIFNEIALVLSLPIVFCTLLVYTLVRKLQTLHGRFIMRHVVIILITTDVFILCMEFNFVERTSFVVLAMQFFCMASFHWITVMCFDIWSTFSGLVIMGENENEELETFKIYSIYAWGSSLIVSILTVYVLFPSSSESSDGANPGFRIDNDCMFCAIFHFLCYTAMIVHIAVIKVLRIFKDRNPPTIIEAETNNTSEEEWYSTTEV